MGDLRESLPLKISALLLAAILALAAILSTLLLAMAYQEGYYQEDTFSYADTRSAQNIAEEICRNALYNPGESFSSRWEQMAVTITDSSGKVVLQQGTVAIPEAAFQLELWLEAAEEKTEMLPAGSYQVLLSVGNPFYGAENPFRDIRQFFRIVYPIRHALLLLAPLSLLLCLLCLIFLACSAGRRKGENGIVANGQDRIPFDLYLSADILLAAFFSIAWKGMIDNARPVLRLALYILGFLLLSAMVLALFMTTMTRLKLGRPWENTLCWKLLQAIRGLFCRLCREMRRIFRLFPMAWRTVLLLSVLLFLQSFLFLWGCQDGFGLPILLMLAMDAAALVSSIYISGNLQQLKDAGQALAEGKLETKVDTGHMPWDLRQHGEHLNAIGQGMNRAVEQRMRSERLKTELITNVSHDIKTPLTSIVNYVDLLKKEEGLPEQAAGYVAVLDRQSRRLKKLTEDLVEASKASTGNIKVQLQPIIVNEIINQAIGDYDRRLADGKLEVIINTFEGNLAALADGRLLWRVLDNLLSNVCKYALAGSRVYIDLVSRRDLVALSIKNISRDRLNISADELMERFVRGDVSRHTEGSGLGLNIAKSLMELMGGSFSLAVDGDLFKAELTLKSAPLPEISSRQEAQKEL